MTPQQVAAHVLNLPRSAIDKAERLIPEHCICKYTPDVSIRYVVRECPLHGSWVNKP